MLFYSLIIVGMLFLLHFMTETFWEVKRTIDTATIPSVPMIKMSLWGLLFGILIEWQGLKKILTENIKVNWLLVPTIVLISLSFIPRVYWGIWFGMGTNWFITLLKIAEIQMLLNVLSGILLVRSLTKM